MKRIHPIFIFIFLLTIILVTTLVSAQLNSIDLREGSETIINLIIDFSEPFLQAFLGGEDYTGLLLFERFLIFIIIVSMVYLSLTNIAVFDDKKSILWIVAIIVPLLSIRFISFEWINTILLQYQVLGIALVGILPFLIYLFFLHNVSESTIVRKIGWIFFIVIYFGLWSTSTIPNYGQIYLWTMIISAVFLFLDGSIHKAIMNQRMKEAGHTTIYQRISEIDRAIYNLRNSSIPQKTKDKQIKKFEKEKIRLYKRV